MELDIGSGRVVSNEITYDASSAMRWAKNHFTLSHGGHHGLFHWANVAANARILGQCMDVEVSERVGTLFAILHDFARLDEGSDPGHGARAADRLIKSPPPELGELTKEERDDLLFAIRYHNTGLTEFERPNVAMCWDADRFDLSRLGITPDRRFLSCHHFIDDDLWEVLYSNLIVHLCGVPERAHGV